MGYYRRFLSHDWVHYSFQFPLWDTNLYVVFRQMYIFFQFPLWDTANDFFSINSIITLTFTALSIPFMGYIY